MSEKDNAKYTKRVVATGNGFNVRIPKDTVTILGIKEGSIVEVDLKVIKR